MNIPFLDRLLICSDCRGEFIFTAGEQTFFEDKQFKNDPKRCKPCKSRRSGLAAAALGGVAAAGLARVETRTQCSECNIETTVPFRPTQGRPVLCRECFQTRNRGLTALSEPRGPGEKGYASVLLAEDTASALTEVSSSSGGQGLSPAAALVAAVSMACASASSSVSSAADLASIRPSPGQAAQSAASSWPASSYAGAAPIEVGEAQKACFPGK